MAVSERKLRAALQAHRDWAGSGGDDGRRLDVEENEYLRDLEDENLSGADLRGAHLAHVNLKYAN